MGRPKRVPLTKPADLKQGGSDFWDHVVKAMRRQLKATDQAALTMACRWIDRFDEKREAVGNGIDVSLGIATDKFLLLSAKFGFTPHDRKNVGEGPQKPKATEKKTSLDELKPSVLLGGKSAKPTD